MEREGGGGEGWRGRGGREDELTCMSITGMSM